MLEFIHLFVEVLDQYFGSVCELDLVFNFHKVYQILDEMVIGGEIMETSKVYVNRALRICDFYAWAIVVTLIQSINMLSFVDNIFFKYAMRFVLLIKEIC